jgi:hypothetical protein
MQKEPGIGRFAKKMRGTVSTSAEKAWSAAKLKVHSASGEAKSTAVGGLAGGAAATTAGAHVGIAAFGTAVSGAALLPVVVCVGVGAVAGFAAFKLFKDVKGRASQPGTDEAIRLPKQEPPKDST